MHARGASRAPLHSSRNQFIVPIRWTSTHNKCQHVRGQQQPPVQWRTALPTNVGGNYSVENTTIVLSVVVPNEQSSRNICEVLLVCLVVVILDCLMVTVRLNCLMSAQDVGLRASIPQAQVRWYFLTKDKEFSSSPSSKSLPTERLVL